MSFYQIQCIVILIQPSLYYIIHIKLYVIMAFMEYLLMYVNSLSWSHLVGQNFNIVTTSTVLVKRSLIMSVFAYYRVILKSQLFLVKNYKLKITRFSYALIVLGSVISPINQSYVLGIRQVVYALLVFTLFL